MKRRLLVALAASALIVVTAVPMGTAAADPQKRFQRVGAADIDKDLLKSILADREIDVIVEMDGNAAIRRDLTKAGRIEVAGILKARQDRLNAPIRALGGRVQATFQYAFNGIKVRMAARRVPELAKLAGVKALHPVPTYYRTNVTSVPFIGTHRVWQDLGVTGDGQTIAVIDTGIDYTHANFGGEGTEAAYDANDPDVVEDGSFPTAKVIDGWDFVGDAYDPSEEETDTPEPDPDPLDCHGHGSHVAGTAAGFGVLADHSTYDGPYNSTTYSNDFGIGPGVAPEADLIALKVFGCDGGTNVLTEALDWVAEYNVTHTDQIDVVNMSLGGIGGDYSPDAIASNALVTDGVVVVASAGNDGPNAYMVGAPGAATKILTVAASDVTEFHPGAVIDRAVSPDLTGINQNNYPDLPVAGTLAVIGDGEGGLSLGCTAEDYGDLDEGSIAVIQRGVCAFVEKGAAAEAAGAVGVIVVNRDDIADPNELPTFIGYTPSMFDIPMIGIGRGAKATLIASDGEAATLEDGPDIENPDFLANADFSSGGPRLGDSHMKPDVTAPGVNTVSTAVGLGFKGDTLSGTSMAAPHAAGVAALVRDRNPTWKPETVKAVIVGTAVSNKVAPFNTRVAGSGLIQPRRAIDSVAHVQAQDGTPSLSFGYDPRNSGRYIETLHFTIYNRSNSAITYDLTSPGIVTLSTNQVTVPANSNRTISATASRSTAQLAGTLLASQTVPGGTAWGGLVNYRGVITAKPTVIGNGRYTLNIPYQAVPRGASNVVTSGMSEFVDDEGILGSSTTLRNTGIHRTFADVYAWGLSDPKDLGSSPAATNDVRAVGLQVLPAEVLTGEADETDRALIWAVNTYGRWSGGFQNVYSIAIFGEDPENPEFIVLAIDLGLITTGGLTGQVVSLVIDSEGNVVSDLYVADAPANGSTILIPALASDIGRDAADAVIDYEVIAENVFDSSDPADGFVDVVDGRASLAPFAPAVSQGDFISLTPGQSVVLELFVDSEAMAANTTKGWMIVALDDLNGAPQAALLPAPQPAG